MGSWWLEDVVFWGGVGCGYSRGRCSVVWSSHVEQTSRMWGVPKVREADVGEKGWKTERKMNRTVDTVDDTRTAKHVDQFCPLKFEYRNGSSMMFPSLVTQTM